LLLTVMHFGLIWVASRKSPRLSIWVIACRGIPICGPYEAETAWWARAGHNGRMVPVATQYIVAPPECRRPSPRETAPPEGIGSPLEGGGRVPRRNSGPTPGGGMGPGPPLGCGVGGARSGRGAGAALSGFHRRGERGCPPVCTLAWGEGFKWEGVLERRVVPGVSLGGTSGRGGDRMGQYVGSHRDA
jgi:hypothetical protein